MQLPICLIVGEAGPDGFHPLVLSNDSQEDARVKWAVRVEQEVISTGEMTLSANQNWQVARMAAVDGPRLLRLEWETGGREFASHYLEAQPPLSQDWYRR